MIRCDCENGTFHLDLVDLPELRVEAVCTECDSRQEIGGGVE